jgi:hypothetical protein
MKLRIENMLSYYVNAGPAELARRVILTRCLEAGVESIRRMPLVGTKRVRRWNGCSSQDEYANQLAVRVAIRQGKQLGAGAVMLLWDTTQVASELYAKIGALELPEEWGVLFLGYGFAGMPQAVEQGVLPADEGEPIPAMIVNEAYYNKVLQTLRPRSAVDDSWETLNDRLRTLEKNVPCYGCCPALAWNEGRPYPWGNIPMKEVRLLARKILVRAGTTVALSAEAADSAAKQKWEFYYADGKPASIAHQRLGGIETALAAALAANSEWVATVNQRVHPLQEAELFLDRRLASAQLSTAGVRFLPVDAKLANWAISAGLDAELWQEGQPVRVPNVDGPLTLWSTVFLRKIVELWEATGREVPISAIVAAEVSLGRARVEITQAKTQAWQTRDVK